jgi:hypothetical protein
MHQWSGRPAGYPTSISKRSPDCASLHPGINSNLHFALFEDLCKVPDHLVAQIIHGQLITLPRPAPRYASPRRMGKGDSRNPSQPPPPDDGFRFALPILQRQRRETDGRMWFTR